MPTPNTLAYPVQGLYTGSFNECNGWGAPPSKIASIWGTQLAPSHPEGNSAAGFSTSSQTTYEDEYDCRSSDNMPRPRRDTQEDAYQVRSANQNRGVYSQEGAHGRQAGENSPLNTSGSSLTEEIFNHALSNLEFLSDEENDIPSSKEIANKKASLEPQVKI